MFPILTILRRFSHCIPSLLSLMLLPADEDGEGDDDNDDDDIDCRVFRFNWTDEMFAAAMQQFKVIKYHS